MSAALQYIIVALAMLWALRTVWRRLRPPKPGHCASDGCGSCGSCDAGGEPVQRIAAANLPNEGDRP